MCGHSLHRRAIVALAGILAALLLTGCPRATGTLTGKVTYQGKPLKAAAISFISTDSGRSYAAGLKEDETYYIPDMQAGQYKVCVDTAYLKGSPGATPMPGLGGQSPASKSPAAAQQAANSKKYLYIPDKYADPDKTDLTYTFKGGSENWDIELK